MNLIIKILISSIAVMITARLLPGVTIDTYTTALLTAIVLGLLNNVLKPLLILFTIPVTIVTMGLFLLVINASIIMMASHLLNGFRVEGFFAALFFSIILSLITGLLESLLQTGSHKNE